MCSRVEAADTVHVALGADDPKRAVRGNEAAVVDRLRRQLHRPDDFVRPRVNLVDGSTSVESDPDTASRYRDTARASAKRDLGLHRVRRRRGRNRRPGSSSGNHRQHREAQRAHNPACSRLRTGGSRHNAVGAGCAGCNARLTSNLLWSGCAATHTARPERHGPTDSPPGHVAAGRPLRTFARVRWSLLGSGSGLTGLRRCSQGRAVRVRGVGPLTSGRLVHGRACRAV